MSHMSNDLIGWMKDASPKVVPSQDFRRNGEGRNRGQF